MQKWLARNCQIAWQSSLGVIILEGCVRVSALKRIQWCFVHCNLPASIFDPLNHLVWRMQSVAQMGFSLNLHFAVQCRPISTWKIYCKRDSLQQTRHICFTHSTHRVLCCWDGTGQEERWRESCKIAFVASARECACVPSIGNAFTRRSGQSVGGPVGIQSNINRVVWRTEHCAHLGMRPALARLTRMRSNASSHITH